MIKPKEILENFPCKKNIEAKQKWRLKLDKNENIYGISNFIESAVKNIDFEKISKYPNSEKFIDKLSLHLNIDKNDIILTNNCAEAVAAIARVYLSSQDEFITCQDIESEVRADILLQNAKIKNVDFRFGILESEQEIRENTKIVYCSTPNFDTGELIRASVFEELLKKYQDILFIINCSYINYADNVTLADFIDLAKQYENAVIIKSFSYDYALAGLGLCYIYAQKNITDNLKKIMLQNNVNCIALSCGCAILNNYEHFEEVKAENKNAREIFLKGLSEKGFEPYPSSSNFILCDFFNYCDFYYKKLKNNGVIVKKFDEDSPYSTCLRMGIPKIGGIKYILELLNKKDVLIINPDNVIFDISESLDCAIAQTIQHFTGSRIAIEKIANIRNLGGYNCAWDIAKYILEQFDYSAELEEIINVFIDLFYIQNSNKNDFLINKDKLLISKNVLEQLSEKYDLVIFSDRLKMHIDYSLKKNELDKYFHYEICADNLTFEQKKPNPKGIIDIIRHCPYKSIKYIGANVDDIICAKNANIENIGVVNIKTDKTAKINNFRHLGANYIIENSDEIIKFLDKNEQK